MYMCMHVIATNHSASVCKNVSLCVGVQVSTYQMAILLQYNAATSHTLTHLEASTQLKEVSTVVRMHRYCILSVNPDTRCV